jgi:type II secretion system protein N
VKKAVLILSLIVLVIVGSWFIVLPESFIITLIENALPGENIYLKTEGFKKGLFYNFRVEKILLMQKGNLMKNESGLPVLSSDSSSSEAPLLILDDVSGQMNLLSVARLNPQLEFTTHLQAGRVIGEVDLMGQGAITLRGNNLPVQEIPFFERIGIRGEGILAGTFLFRKGKEELKFSVTNAKLKNTSFGGVFLPLDVFHTVHGFVTLGDGTMDVRSFNLQGDGIYARVKGNATGRQVNMDVELMVDSSFQETPILQAMVGQYKVSPGYYVIPLKSVLPAGIF